jgi:hypothetical protein
VAWLKNKDLETTSRLPICGYFFTEQTEVCCLADLSSVFQDCSVHWQFRSALETSQAGARLSSSQPEIDHCILNKSFAPYFSETEELSHIF